MTEAGALLVRDIFPPDDVAARFVVAMSMARNDLWRALQDAQRAADDDDGLYYRHRLIAGHLVEALDSLGAYSDAPEVRALCHRVSPAGKRHLRLAR